MSNIGEVAKRPNIGPGMYIGLESTMKKPTMNISANNGMGACKRGLLPPTPRKENQQYKVAACCMAHTPYS